MQHEGRVHRGEHHGARALTARRRTGLLAPPRTARLAPVVARTHSVRAGDTLTSIARASLGDAGRWRELYELNRDRLASPNALPEGLVLPLEPTAVISDGAATAPQGVISNNGAAGPMRGLAALALGWLAEMLADVAARHAVDAALLVALVRHASAGDPSLVGPDGRLGLLQLPAATARALGIAHPLHPRENLEGGARYMAFLLGYYNQRVELALAAFHAGVGTVDRYGGLPPCDATRAFVAAVLADVAAAHAA